MLRILTIALLAAFLPAVPMVAAQVSEAQAAKIKKKKIEVGKEALPYTAPKENWLNVKKPLAPEDLRNKVILLEFSFRH